ncbi:unnamed protein product [Rotaria socialis]
MNRSCVQLRDLPGKLLIFIFKQINNVEVLYSLFGVNERFDSILQDSICTNHFNFLKCSLRKFLSIFSPDIIFHRFCVEILPAIREKIQWHDFDSSSMKQILCAADYPNSLGLGLFNIEEETIRSLFIDRGQTMDLNEIIIALLNFENSIYQNENVSTMTAIYRMTPASISKIYSR